MTQLTILKAVGGHAIGDTINISEGAAQFLINAGRAEAVKQPAKTAPRTKTKPVDKSGSEDVGGTSSASDRTTAG